VSSLPKSSESPKIQDPGAPSTTDGTPLFVTFKTGASLLMERGLVDTITPDGLRYIAREVDSWPFGNKPGKLPYGMVGNTRTMETGTFLSYFKDGPPRGGRGRTRKS
jgi:hypothetical protein